VVSLAAMLTLACVPAFADMLDDIKARGKLVVGVKKDVLPWGYLNAKTNVIEGLEPDLAKDLAKRLGVGLELVGLVIAERVNALEERRVDVLIATLSDTPDRRARLTLIEPHYYSAGVNVLARKTEGFKNWLDLRNRRICGQRGAFHNRQVAIEYGADIVPLYGIELVKSALRDGRCSAFLNDDTAIAAMLIDPAWGKQFEMPLPTLYQTPKSVALPPGEFGTRLEAQISNAVVDWHRSGLLRQLEQKWGVPQSTFAREMNVVWTKKSDAGWFCGEKFDKKTPKECR
jgi:polar amino acid transport system substrate-binding protein